MHVFLIAALTADGFIAKDPQRPSTAWTSPQDNKFFTQKTVKAGTIIMGRKTYQTIPKKHRPLKNRLNIIYTNHPQNIKPQPTHINLDSQTKLSNSKLYSTSLPPKQLVKKLVAQNQKPIAICGGSSIYTLYLKAGIVDTLYLTIEPVLFGSGLTLFNQPLNTKLKLTKIHKLSPQTTVLELKTKPHSK